MTTNSTHTNHLLIIKLLRIIVFFVFILFNFQSVKSQELEDSFATLLTNNFETDSIKGIDLFESGKKAYEIGDSNLALQYFLKCIYVRKQLYPENNKLIGFAVNRAGVAFKELGRLNEAIECFQEVIKINSFNHGENTIRNATPYTNIGNVYKQKGNFTDAIKYEKQAIYHYELGDNDNTGIQMNILRTKYNLANNLYLTKQYDKALDLIFSCYKHAPYYLKASFLSLLGNIYVSLNDNINAKTYFLLSIKELRENAEDAEDEIDLADLYIGFTQFLISNEEFTEAENNLSLASQLIKKYYGKYGRDVSNLYFAYGNLYSEKQFDTNSISDFRKVKIKNLNIALKYYQKAIIAVSENFSDTLPPNNPLIEQIKFEALTLHILQNKSKTYFQLAELTNGDKIKKQVKLENALEATKLASNLLNKLRTGTVSDESKIVMTQLQNSTYLFSVKVAYELFQLTNKNEYFEIAFQNAERNKSASLLDNLTDESARQGSLIPDSLIQREENINDQIAFVNQQLFNFRQLEQPDTIEINKLVDQLFQLEHNKNDLTRYLENNYKDYFQLKYTNQKITINDIKKKLTKDEIILEYVLDRTKNEDNTNDLYLFLISKNEFSLKKINVDSTFIQNIETVYQFLSASDFINIPLVNYKKYLNSANNLYTILIKPVEEKILNHTITIIPDGKLSYIPFDALLYNLPAHTNKLDFINLDYLVKKFSFNYSYSANLYLNKYNTKKRANKKLLAFAPEYGKYRNNEDNEFKKLAPLTGIQEEVNNISNYIKSDLLVKANATESNFKKSYHEYDILHLAMHAIINDSLPVFSKLAFTPENNTISSEDGWLTTSEIYNLNLNARLSVLSACNTGSGTIREGEGVISLARGFFYAGCPSIVMSLWEVEDRSGASIMDEFYRLLDAGKKKHESLRMAKLKHIKNADPVTAHPHIWLGYVTVGNTDSLYTSYDYYFFFIILAVVLAVVIDQVLRNKKARKNRA